MYYLFRGAIQAFQAFGRNKVLAQNASTKLSHVSVDIGETFHVQFSPVRFKSTPPCLVSMTSGSVNMDEVKLEA